MNLSIICAMDSKSIIGKENSIPWIIKEDIQYFKYITLGKVVIMGRRTCDSIGQLLKSRKNIVLTKNIRLTKKDFIYNDSVKDSIKNIFPYKNCIVIGGAQIYRIFHKYCNFLYITEIPGDFRGNKYFSMVKKSEWDFLGGIEKQNHIYRIYRRRLKK